MDVLRAALANPAMQSLLTNPDFMRDMVSNNPMLRRMTEANPQVAQVLNDPAMLQDIVRIMGNPVGAGTEARAEGLGLRGLWAEAAGRGNGRLRSFATGLWQRRGPQAQLRRIGGHMSLCVFKGGKIQEGVVLWNRVCRPKRQRGLPLDSLTMPCRSPAEPHARAHAQHGPCHEQPGEHAWWVQCPAPGPRTDTGGPCARVSGVVALGCSRGGHRRVVGPAGR